MISEPQFEAWISDLVSESGRAELVELLHESHPIYAERSAAATARMRGWVLLALGRIGLTQSELIYVLDELDSGQDAYLVAAAAYALRTFPSPDASLLPFVEHALENIRYRDDALCLHEYGSRAKSSVSSTTATEQLQLAAQWLHDNAATHSASCCSCHSKPAKVEPTLKPTAIPPVTVEDQDGTRLQFAEYVLGQPTIVVFFYTRCDNPHKCSLTIARLGQIQRALRQRGLDKQIRTAAVTYDPVFDTPERLRGYAQSRSMGLEADHRMLRAVEGWDKLRAYFELGVNFIGSLVNRHRIELFILDCHGRIAASFERLKWNEREVIDTAVRLLPDRNDSSGKRSAAAAGGVLAGTLAFLVAALLPKCPMCWSAYLSALGIVAFEQIPLPLLGALLLVNLLILLPRDRSPLQFAAFALGAAGAFTLLVLGNALDLPQASAWGVALTAAGSLLAVSRRALSAGGTTRSPSAS